MTSDLAPADDAFLKVLRDEIPDLEIGQAEARHLEEPRGRWFGRPGPIAWPRSTGEVAALIAVANRARVGIVPRGGGTGLVGGAVMAEGPMPLLVSLARMRRLRAIWPEEDAMVIEAGANVAEARAAAEDAGRLFPLAYAADGTAEIGGALAVNSGGLNVLRYGMARDLTLGIEAVLPDGSVLHGLKRLRKDNTGYDLRHLLIGAEGTLGLITAAALRLFPRPVGTATAFFAVRDPDAALTLLAMLRERAGEAVTAFELIDGTGLGFLAEVLPDLRQPFAERPDWGVLAELGVGTGIDARAILLDLFEAALDQGLVADGVLAESEAQRRELWEVRESIPEANRLIGAVASHDISLPLSELPRFIADGKGALTRERPYRVNAFGHLGDGNLHFNVFPPEGETREAHADRAEAISREVHDLVVERGGSFSAEHGIGRLKVADMARYGDPARLAAMQAIKAALDPNGIMNPGVMLPRGR